MSKSILVGLVAVILLLWGPETHFGLDPSFMDGPHYVDYSGGPYWVNYVIRSLYLVVLPTAAWVVLKYVWRIWKPDADAEDRLSRALVGAIAGALFVGTVLAIQAESHEYCETDYYVPVGSGTGRECIKGEDAGERSGEIVILPGPDVSKVFWLALGGAVALGVAVFFPFSKLKRRGVDRGAEEYGEEPGC
jgi:hypothetical protein